MREIGVRELKAHLSEVLRQVEHGEPVRVTSRGRTVAEIVPAGAPPVDERLLPLIAEGGFTPPTRHQPASQPTLIESDRLASDVVLADREDER
ncbi:MAG TPA: type II toxin-antitoxin system prevent-host-death family antitoxin [Conexibacter sp.]|jgi:prevent-host-death family protein